MVPWFDRVAGSSVLCISLCVALAWKWQGFIKYWCHYKVMLTQYRQAPRCWSSSQHIMVRYLCDEIKYVCRSHISRRGFRQQQVEVSSIRQDQYLVQKLQGGVLFQYQILAVVSSRQNKERSANQNKYNQHNMYPHHKINTPNSN